MTHETTRTGAEPRWSAPVWVRLDNGLPEPVLSPREALERLTHRWPAGRGRHYRSAKASCEAAMNKQIVCEHAREAFLRASLESQMLLPGSG